MYWGENKEIVNQNTYHVTVGGSHFTLDEFESLFVMMFDVLKFSCELIMDIARRLLRVSDKLRQPTIEN